MTGIIHINIDPILFHLGNLSIHWYGVMYVVAFAAGYKFGVLPYILKRGFERQFTERVLFWTIIFGLLGARLYFVVQQPDLNFYLQNPVQIIAVWQGGMAFFGAIIGSITAIAVMSIRHKKSFWYMWDAAALFGVVGQPFGRIGNIINGDILGSRSDLPWATAYDHPNAILQSCCIPHLGYQPAAAYEALGTITIGLLLLVLIRRGARAGTIGITYVGLYCLSQFLIFFLRDSEPVIGLGLKQAQWTSIVVFIVVVPFLVRLRRRFPMNYPVPIAEETPASGDAEDAADAPKTDPAPAAKHSPPRDADTS